MPDLNKNKLLLQSLGYIDPEADLDAMEDEEFNRLFSQYQKDMGIEVPGLIPEPEQMDLFGGIKSLMLNRTGKTLEKGKLPFPGMFPEFSGPVKKIVDFVSPFAKRAGEKILEGGEGHIFKRSPTEDVIPTEPIQEESAKDLKDALIRTTVPTVAPTTAGVSGLPAEADQSLSIEAKGRLLGVNTGQPKRGSKLERFMTNPRFVTMLGQLGKSIGGEGSVGAVLGEAGVEQARSKVYDQALSAVLAGEDLQGIPTELLSVEQRSSIQDHKLKQAKTTAEISKLEKEVEQDVLSDEDEIKLRYGEMQKIARIQAGGGNIQQALSSADNLFSSLTRSMIHAEKSEKGVTYQTAPGSTYSLIGQQMFINSIQQFGGMAERYAGQVFPTYYEGLPENALFYIPSMGKQRGGIFKKDTTKERPTPIKGF